MTVTNVDTDVASLTLTLTAEFAASVERVWQVWADPRKLERWWGPPLYPATFVEHELSPGGRMSYFMTSPEGERYHGWWSVVAVDAPWSFSFEDGFADSDGAVNPDLPTTQGTVTLTDLGDGRTRMQLVSRFASPEAMQQVIALGLVEGITAAAGQIDGLLA